MPMTDSSLFLLQLRLLERPRRAAVETTAGRKRKWENGGLELFFAYIGNNHIPTDEVIFFRGVGQPPTSIFYMRMEFHAFSMVSLDSPKKRSSRARRMCETTLQVQRVQVGVAPRRLASW